MANGKRCSPAGINRVAAKITTGGKLKNKDLPQIDGVTVHCAHSKIVSVGELKPYPRNNKKHPDQQLDLMCKAIKAQGWRAPITVSNQSGFIVRGHGRLEAAKRLGLNAVPVDFQDYASPAAEQADRIADNKLAELAEYDMDALKEELLELDTGALDMDITGFDAGALETLMTQFHVDEVGAPELKDGDRAPFRQATFTLHDEQWEAVEAAIAKAKAAGHGESAVNENSNGNALAWIADVFNHG